MTTNPTMIYGRDGLPIKASGEWTILLREECCIGLEEQQEVPTPSSSNNASPVGQLFEGARAIASLSFLLAIAWFSGVTDLFSPLAKASNSDHSAHQSTSYSDH